MSDTCDNALNFNVSHIETIILKEEIKEDLAKLASIKINSPPPVHLRTQRKRRKPRVLFTQEQVSKKLSLN